MFENLSENLSGILQNIQGKSRISDINIASTLKEIRRALLSADVNHEVVKKIISEVKIEATGEKVLTSLSPGEVFTKIVNDKLTTLMGGDSKEINLTGNPSIILIAGLQGSGKTTFTAKLAKKLKKEGKQVLLVACDVYRPAAIQQLQTLAGSIEVDIYLEEDNKQPLQIAKNAIQYAKNEHKKVIIIDTAGRLAIDEKMMKEISLLKKNLNPQETLFVVDAMTGQDAVNTAKIFNRQIDYDGVVLTKLDGDTRGGAAISIRFVVDKPIKFVSTGEKPEQLEVFHPDRMASRILGMGDIVSLVERVQEEFSKKEIDNLNKRLRKNKIDFNDMLKQIRLVKKLGGTKAIANLIPSGMSAQKGELNDAWVTILESIILSMTPKERRVPEIINFSRRKRIAKGSGNTIKEVNNLVSKHNTLKRTLKKINRKGGSLKEFEKMFRGDKKD